jgi:hypothetical protein
MYMQALPAECMGSRRQVGITLSESVHPMFKTNMSPKCICQTVCPCNLAQGKARQVETVANTSVIGPDAVNVSHEYIPAGVPAYNSVTHIHLAVCPDCSGPGGLTEAA